MTTRREQVAKQCRVMVHLAETLAAVYRANAEIFESAATGPDDIVELVGVSTTAQMNALGDILSGMDAVDEDADAWTHPVFEAANELWPQAVT